MASMDRVRGPFKPLASCSSSGCTILFLSDLVRNSKDWFCRDAAHKLSYLFPFLYCPGNEKHGCYKMYITFSLSFKGYVYLFIYEQFIITLELNGIESFSWVKRSFS